MSVVVMHFFFFLPFILFAFQVFGSTEECIWLELGIITSSLGFSSKPGLLFPRDLLVLTGVLLTFIPSQEGLGRSWGPLEGWSF